LRGAVPVSLRENEGTMIVVGLMSGIALDGIEVAICEIRGAPPALHVEVLSSLSIPWPVELIKMVKKAGEPGSIDIADLCLLDVAIGEAFAAAALEGIAYAGYYPEQVDLIGLEGQTVRHEVREDGHVLASLQIGQAAIVTEWTGITTVSDFRQRDVAAGGQGAPLIGYVDWLLLRHPRRYRAVHYLNRIASVTFLPPLSAPEVEPLAFDIGPGTSLIDFALAQRHDEALPNGHAVHTGMVDAGLLTRLMAHPFLERRPPKTVNHLMFSETFAREIWEEARAAGLPPSTILETFVAFTMESALDAYRRFAPGPIEEIIMAGKGRQYPHLMQRMRAAFEPVPILAHEDVGMDSASKDGLGIAVLAYESWHNRPGTRPSQTGVQRETTLGAVIPGQNYELLLKATWQTPA
jgi:anhydro-N-acetylmuramic acid kinase